MIRLEDLEHDLQAIIAELSKHPKVTVATGARTVVFYVQGRQAQKLVEARIPEEYRHQVQVTPTTKIRPANEPTSKASKKRGPPRRILGGRTRQPS
jgi:hypothetical protein